MVSGEILGKVGQDPSISKSNCLHVDVFISVFFIEVYSIDSCKVIEDLLKVVGLKCQVSLFIEVQKNFGQNWSRCKCFQVQLLAC